MASGMAERGSCPSTMGEMTIWGAPAASRRVGLGPRAAPGAGDGPRPARAFERAGHGLGESLGPALTPPCMRTRAVSQHMPPPTETPVTPSPRGTCPAPRPTARRPGTLRDPGSHPNAARVLLADLVGGDQRRVPRAAARRASVGFLP